MTRSYLFIGGSRDGQRREVEKEEHFVHVPLTARPMLLDSPPTTRSLRLPPLETYRRMPFTHGNNNPMFYVYIADGVSNDDALRMLVDGNRKPKNQTNPVAIVENKIRFLESIYGNPNQGTVGRDYTRVRINILEEVLGELREGGKQ